MCFLLGWFVGGLLMCCVDGNSRQVTVFLSSFLPFFPVIFLIRAHKRLENKFTPLFFSCLALPYLNLHSCLNTPSPSIHSIRLVLSVQAD
ncbi:hypothetical protein P153DRAFT_178552 [Dothidotthia symphoricarpi CBS 119687]|uniref:Secreted peptide n=1 Tax=Dothidotthia symphoricarpi CBS 119687 TaxID=1392245 RepID=A0A6A6APG4_9PLEO|nr:uncharacterized protein P153DRAFT_178552 [Dothidotthia symphoricarpi CBS 119687]KAF2133038.1 hypothetical protein P153DRAFT_178552 [Dothidotthia symphoricarpi CBS 119687]